VKRLAQAPDHLLIDAMKLDITCAQTSIIYGDSLSISIAAASVVAKVYRDRRMCELHEVYPQYGLASHKGYSTPEHLAALDKHGPCPLHRRSFRPVAQASLPWDDIHHGAQIVIPEAPVVPQNRDVELGLELTEEEIESMGIEASENQLSC
jgi:ribonuclease HII